MVLDGHPCGAETLCAGWAVVPNTLPREKAEHYKNEAYKWLESWGLGYNRNDPSTRKLKNLPYNVRGGLYAL